MNIIGENIKAIREKRQMTQDELAETAGVHRVTLAKYETGKSIPGADVLGRIAKALHVKADRLLGDESDDLTEDERDMLEYRDQIRNDPTRRTLYELARHGKDRDVEQAVAILHVIMRDHPDDYFEQK